MRRHLIDSNDINSLGNTMASLLPVAAAIAAVLLTIPIAASAAPVHLLRAESIQNADYNRHYGQSHHRRWVQHQRYWHHYN
jgi:hypothetical protein